MLIMPSFWDQVKSGSIKFWRSPNYAQRLLDSSIPSRVMAISLVSGVRFQVSGTTQNSRVSVCASEKLYSISVFRNILFPGTEARSNLKFIPTPDIWNPAPDTWHLTPDTWHLTPDTWHPTPVQNILIKKVEFVSLLLTNLGSRCNFPFLRLWFANSLPGRNSSA